jgi:TRAP-type C4-dicarboxylate transport system permease small subunit
MATTLPSVPNLSDIDTLVQNLLAVLARLIGIASFIMLIVGGFQHLTSTGDPKKAELANKTLTGAVTGIFILIGGWLLIKLIEVATGVNLTKDISICITHCF